jgi:short-subunit dehydrogenase
MKKYVLIVGGTKGLGLEIAQVFLNLNYSVICLGRTIDKISKIYPEITFLSHDVRSNVSVKSNLLNDLVKTHGIPQHIILNAGISTASENFNPSLEMNVVATNAIGISEWLTLISSNFNLANKNMPLTISVITSLAGLAVTRKAISYCATKSFLIRFTQGLASHNKFFKRPFIFIDFRLGFFHENMTDNKALHYFSLPLNTVAKKVVKKITSTKQSTYTTLYFRWKIIATLISILPEKLLYKIDSSR